MRPSLALSIVACLFIVSGVGASIESLINFFHLYLSINLAFVNLFIGIGLLRRKPRALQWAVFVTWLGLILLLGAIIISMFMPWPGQLQVYGQNLSQTSRPLGVAFEFSLFGLMIWQRRVLNSLATRQLFV